MNEISVERNAEQLQRAKDAVREAKQSVEELNWKIVALKDEIERFEQGIEYAAVSGNQPLLTNLDCDLPKKKKHLASLKTQKDKEMSRIMSLSKVESELNRNHTSLMMKRKTDVARTMRSTVPEKFDVAARESLAEYFVNLAISHGLVPQLLNLNLSVEKLQNGTDMLLTKLMNQKYDLRVANATAACVEVDNK